jgi:hypothetical protein
MLKAFDDYLSPKVIALSILSFLITLAILFVLFYSIFDYTGEFKNIFSSLFSENIEYILQIFKRYHWLSFIVEHKFIMLFIHYLLYFGFGLILYYLFFAIYTFVVSFFNIYFVRHLRNKYYVDIELKGMNIITTVVFYIKTICITVILFLLLSPTYFLPALNLLIFVPIYYFFHKTIVFDVSSVINTTKEYRKIKKVNWSELKAHTGYCFLLTFIPIFGILLYPYYVLYIGHYLLKETQELRYMNDFTKS